VSLAPSEAPLVARVVPDVTGLDKQFDYLVPQHLRARVAVGSMVRVPLHGRKVAGWVVSLGAPDPAVPIEKLVEIATLSSIGPMAEVIELAQWAATRWGSPRVRPFLVVADPPRMVKLLPPTRRTVVGGAPVVRGHRCTTIDEAERLKHYGDALRILYEDVPGVGMFQYHAIYAARREIQWQPTAGESFAVFDMKWQP